MATAYHNITLHVEGKHTGPGGEPGFRDFCERQINNELNRFNR